MSARTTAVDALTRELRERVLDGTLPPGTPLREQRLATEHGLARHTVRAALRALAAEGLARVEPHRGVRVAGLGRADLEALGELRVALEVEGARLALARHGGRLPAAVHAAARDLARACRAADGFAPVTEAHEALHHALVAASGSPRIAAAHAGLAGELRLFLTQLRPAYDLEELATQHGELLRALERDGADVLRAHVADSTRRLAALL